MPPLDSLDDECIHLMSITDCVLCNGRSRREEKAALWQLDDYDFSTSTNVVCATYDGNCPACPGSIYVGDPITRDDQGRWVHQDCS